jgi:hypothetical protein
MNELLFWSIRIELHLGHTFAKIALKAKDSEKRQRNLRNARRAYETATSWLSRRELTQDQKESLREALGQLKDDLVLLGVNEQSG